MGEKIRYIFYRDEGETDYTLVGDLEGDSFLHTVPQNRKQTPPPPITNTEVFYILAHNSKEETVAFHCNKQESLP